MFKPEIAIIIPTVSNDKSILSTLYSIIEIYQDNWYIVIIDQNKNHSEDKQLLYSTIASQYHKEEDKRIEILYESDINLGVQKAVEKNIPYCLVSQDSVRFKKSMNNINEILKYFKRYDLIGLNIENKFKGEKIFTKEGIKTIKTSCKTCSSKKLVIYNCDIVRNFFITKTELLSEYKENIEWFYKLKQRGKKIGYTNYFKGRKEETKNE